MSRKLIVAAIVVAAFAVSFIAKKALTNKELRSSEVAASVRAGEKVPVSYNRIVSLAPSITESLYALGMMDRVVGVTRYCDYPPEALTKTNIGGYLDPNYEAIVMLQPDLIFMLAEHEAPRERLSQLGFKIVVVNHKNISGILRSIEIVGESCGVLQKAQSITDNIKSRMNHIREKTRGLPSPRVLVSIFRDRGSGTLAEVTISGKGSFNGEMIERIGGLNAYEGAVAFPIVSSEGIIQMNPDVIIDIVPDLEENSWDPEMIRSEWNAIPQVNAVKNHRIYLFSNDYDGIPGPRFILTMEKLARAMYPEVDWK